MFYEFLHGETVVAMLPSVTVLQSVTMLRSPAELAGTWLLQSAILIGVGLAVGWRLAARGAAVQSAVLRATLVAVLLAPLATLLLSLLGIAGYGVQIPTAWLEAGRRPVEIRPARLETVVVSDEPANLSRPTSNAIEGFEGPANLFAEAAATPPTGQVAPVGPAAGLPASLDVTSPVAAGTNDAWTPAMWALCGGVVLWLGVSLYLLARLIVSERRMAQLVRCASPADWEVAALCRRVARRLGVRPPQVLISPFLSSPCLFGAWRPKLLLGEEDLTCGTKLHEVLAHELAHLQRRDCAWQLAHRVAASLLWCQPLLWKLVRRLEQVAEDVCDDVVMHMGADRNRYAHMLVGVAELGLPPASATAVNLVSMRSSLGRRVERILDSSRTLSTRTSTRVVSIVAAAALCGTLMAGLLGASGQSQGNEAKAGQQQLAPDTTSSGAARDSGPPAANPAAARGIAAEETSGDAADDESVSVSGQVVDPRGNPVAGARLYWPVMKVTQPERPDDVYLKQVATTDAQGSFAAILSFENFVRRGGLLVARADGFALSWATVAQDDRARNLQMQFAEQAPIRGKVVDSEGNPIEGAEISLLQVYPGEAVAIETWLHTGLRGSIARLSHIGSSRVLGGSLIADGAGGPFVPPVKTDDAGQFTLGGIGRDQLIQLRIEAPHFETAAVYCRTRAGATAEVFDVGNEHVPYLVNVQPAQFTHVAAPSNPITGVVRDEETGEPLAGVVVYSYRFMGNDRTQIGHGLSSTTTDEDGRYSLTGLPLADNLPIQFFPHELPYHPHSTYVDSRVPMQRPIELNAELKRGVVVTGRVTDAESGRGVKGSVFYIPTRDNQPAQLLYRVSTAPVARANDEGDFHYLLPHGSGYLAFEASDDRYERNVATPQDAFHRISSPSFGWHAVVPLDLPPQATSHRAEIQVHRGDFITGTIVDAHGMAVVGGYYAGFRHYRSWRPVEGSEFFVAGYDPATPRRLTFIQLERKLAATVLLQGELERPLRVRLEPYGSVRGRVIDEQGNGIPEVEIDSLRNDQLFSITDQDREALVPIFGFHPEIKDHVVNHVYTNDNGRFTIVGLVPGEAYDLMAMSRKRGDLIHDLTVKPGETLDLGDLRIGQAERQDAQATGGPLE